ncbi:hypothetical protein ACJ72_08059 [Emergomyces africanus]|uniref:Uncharacterized protein n=1 Tax=Emergomyces africanus TaxID=1955775 RepID=A0A1B7NM26_9EURO|nr:hypothetical protein ACJ72_08059 [Emergomyces africanus]
MYSCANYSRGCRGRVNSQGGKCANCLSSNLRRPGSSSPLRGQQNYRRAWDTQKPTETKDQERF